MGYMRHHIIVLTGSEPEITTARDKAVGLFSYAAVSPLMLSTANAYLSFVVTPDGSKEGWGASEEGDNNRAAFIAWLRTEHSYPECEDDPGGCRVDWVEVQFGDDDEVTKITDDSDATVRAWTARQETP